MPSTLKILIKMIHKIQTKRNENHQEKIRACNVDIFRHIDGPL